MIYVLLLPGSAHPSWGWSALCRARLLAGLIVTAACLRRCYEYVTGRPEVGGAMRKPAPQVPVTQELIVDGNRERAAGWFIYDYHIFYIFICISCLFNFITSLFEDERRYCTDEQYISQPGESVTTGLCSMNMH